MNYEDSYFAEAFLQKSLSLHKRNIKRIIVCGIRSHPKNKEQVCWNSSCRRVLLSYKSCKKQKIKEAIVPNMPSCKISWWKNATKKGNKFLVPNLQHYQFAQDGWKMPGIHELCICSVFDRYLTGIELIRNWNCGHQFD